MKIINILIIVAATAVTTHIVTDCSNNDHRRGRLFRSDENRTELDGDLDYVEDYSFNKTTKCVQDRWTHKVVLG